MARAVLLLLLLLIGGGCAHRGGASPADPTAVVAEARANALPFALQGRYSVRIRRGGVDVSTRGGLVLDRGARFRVEVFGPLGTPFLILASDGVALNAWDQSKMTFYRGDQAAEALRSLTGGGVNLADVGRILTGRLPLPDAPARAASLDGDAVALTLDAGQGATVGARLDPKTGLLRALTVQRAEGPVLVSVIYGRPVRVGGERLPSSLNLTIAALNLDVLVSFESWDELGQIPDVFSLSPPTGAVELDLRDALKKAAEAQGGRPPP